MRLGFRWYGPEDAVTLERIRQISCVPDVVSALHDVPAGTAWTKSAVQRYTDIIGEAGLDWTVVESIAVPESIKLRSDGCDAAVEAWCETLHALASADVRVVCYNFMPVFDWLRTDLALQLPDGSNTMAFDQANLGRFDLEAGFDLPAWANAYGPGDLPRLLARYENVDEERLWDALAAFLEAVVPVAESLGISLAIHPDDPPWSIFGLPRIITDANAIRRLTSLVDSPSNGITFCTGSLGALPANDLVAMAREFAPQVRFAHARNVRHLGPGKFQESAHPGGDLDLAAIVAALANGGFDGTIRPDHGRMIWGETGTAGYGLFDRALGATYLRGILDGLGAA
jgi:mannonate dehydratase